jgi:Cu/Ag efflux pump CusA
VVGAAAVPRSRVARLFGTLGQEFVPTLDEKDIAMHAMRIPSTGITQSQAMQYDVERAVSKFPEVAFTYSKTGTAELASDPMPPNVSDTFIILKPKRGMAQRGGTRPPHRREEAARPNEDAHEEDEHGHGHGKRPKVPRRRRDTRRS